MNNKDKIVEVEGAIKDTGKPLPPKQEDKKKENEELRKVFKGEKK